MIYRVRHRTTYSYEGAVSYACCMLRLRPRDSAEQIVLTNAVTVSPDPSGTRVLAGPFGEAVLEATIETPHTKLVIEAVSSVDVNRRAPPQLDTTLAWEEVRLAALRTADISENGPAVFLFPTPRTPITPRITDYARTSFAPGRPIAAAVAEFMRRIHADFTYDSEATTVSTPVAEAFDARRGVCQDYSDIMVSGLRGLGLPAAYVSGYLRTIPPPGQDRLEGADATHAWVSVWCGPREGWIGFDPTNAILAGDDHIELVAGRDQSDAAPIHGVMLGSGDQSLAVEVDVVPDEAAAVYRPTFRALA